MGIGDWLMVSGEAAHRARLAPGTRYMPLDKRGEPYSDAIFAGNPHVARPGEHYDGTIPFVNGVRAYIAEATKERYTFLAYRPHPALVELPASAKALARHTAGAVVFNPTIKDRAPRGKQWPLDQWQQLVRENPSVRWVEIGQSRPMLRGVQWLQTRDIFDALGAVSGALAVVCHEGALHHGAAAVGVPAVVIRGGFISPRVTGYDGQADLYVEDERYPLGCGMRVSCGHCVAAMRSITPEMVRDALHSVLAVA